MNIFNKLMKPIKEGNAYRASLPGYSKWYGLNFADTRKLVDKQKADLTPVACTKTAEDNELYKAGFAYWDEWTGARFSRIENPYMCMDVKSWNNSVIGSHKRPNVDPKSVCRKNLVTGKWQPLLEQL